MKRVAAFIATSLVISIIGAYSYASSYFTFTPETNLVPEDKEIDISFNFKLEGYQDSDFVVRPVLPIGLVGIFIQEDETWISQYDLWTNMPHLQKTMKVKLDFNGSSDLYFQIQNTIMRRSMKHPRKPFGAMAHMQAIWTR